jgi:hypothetical protein
MFLYLLVRGKWEDSMILTSKEAAASASKRYPAARVEIFATDSNGNYMPTYNYYKAGKFIDNRTSQSY